jgi:hypothetical protein
LPDEEAQTEAKSVFKKDLLAAIGIECLRKELLEDLRKQESRPSRIFKHPAVLLVLAFLMTTCLGTGLTLWYQSREWNRQQTYLAQQHYLDEKRASADEVAKAIAETVTAADDMLSLFYWDASKAEEMKRRENWERTSLGWRTSAYTLPPKINTYFKNDQIPKAFEEIAQRRSLIGNSITNLLADYDADKRKALGSPDTQRIAGDALGKLNEIRKQLGRLAELMSREILDDRKAQTMYQ